MGAKKYLTGGVVAVALVAAGVLAGTSIAGGEGEPRTVDEVVVAEPIVAEPAAGQAGTAAKKKRRKPTVRYFQAAVATVPPEGEGVVQPIVCPRRQGEPIAAGAQTTIGLVVNYLSRIHPETQELPPRTYYVGVEDISDTNAPGSGALVEVQCAKNIRVQYGS